MLNLVPQYNTSVLKLVAVCSGQFWPLSYVPCWIFVTIHIFWDVTVVIWYTFTDVSKSCSAFISSVKQCSNFLTLNMRHHYLSKRPELFTQRQFVTCQKNESSATPLWEPKFSQRAMCLIQLSGGWKCFCAVCKEKSDQPEDGPWKGRNMSFRESM